MCEGKQRASRECHTDLRMVGGERKPSRGTACGGNGGIGHNLCYMFNCGARVRSEERRVGKECLE